MGTLARIGRVAGMVVLGAIGLALGMAALAVVMMAAAIVAGGAIVALGLAWLVDTGLMEKASSASEEVEP